MKITKEREDINPPLWGRSLRRKVAQIEWIEKALQQRLGRKNRLACMLMHGRKQPVGMEHVK